MRKIVPPACCAVTTGLCTGLVMLSGAAFAQVIPDGTLPTNVASPNNLNFAIDGGSRSGNNLFHSFSQFSVPTGGSAVFNNAADIQTIFSRVTGGSLSNIDGLIQANGSANLFLLNPSGILFGPNASLNIGGSFIGTTANSVKFADGVEFGAVNSNTTPLLTISVPVGLQMGQNPGGITVQGSGHRLSVGDFTPIDRSNNPIGLQARTGNTFALIGGEVNFVGGIMAVDGGGHLELGSVSDGQVTLNRTLTGWVGDYSAVRQFNDIHLAQQSLLDASGSGGSIKLQGKNINLTESSVALIQNFGTQAFEGITVNATDSLNLTGNTLDGKLGSLIQIDNLGTAQTGDNSILAGHLSLKDGGQITNQTFTQSPGGNITIDVTGSIAIDGFAPGNPNISSSILKTIFSSDNTGDITVSTDNLRILNSGSIASLTLGSGQAGMVRVNAADLIEISGNNPITLIPSSLTSTTINSGNANNVLINTSRLVIREGAAIGSLALFTGSAGSVIINSSQSVDIQGQGVGSLAPSRIISAAEILDPVTQAALGIPPIPKGNAGSLTINTPSLRITDGAFVTVKNDGPGTAGDLQINANSILIDNQGGITASTESGNGGNVRLNLQQFLLMRHNSLISASAAGSGNGGNLSINAPVIVGLENSDIIANAVQGRGGNINITAQGIIGLEFRNTLTPRVDLTNDITASSEFNVNGTVQINTIGVDPNAGLVNLPVDLADPTHQIAQGCRGTQGSSFVVTGRGGMPLSPMEQVMSDRPWTDTRDLSALRAGAPIVPAPAPTDLTAAPFVQATGWRRNPQTGKVELYAEIGTTAVPVPPGVTCAGAIPAETSRLNVVLNVGP
jgi:filamentous hemagglutinin family protein